MNIQQELALRQKITILDSDIERIQAERQELVNRLKNLEKQQVK